MPDPECPTCHGLGGYPKCPDCLNAGGSDQRLVRDLPVYGVMDPDYARFFSKARCTAKMDGYALAIHGTFSRDLDVIAVPWVEKPKEAELFVRHIAHRTGLAIRHPMQLREHGRMVWTLHFTDFGDPRFIDFSVLPTLPNARAMTPAKDQANEK